MPKPTHLALSRRASLRGAWSTSWARTVRDEEGTKRAWAAYRQARAEVGLPNISPGHFSPMRRSSV